MGADKVGICNQSLAELPCEAISTLEERSTAAQWCARLYGPTLRYMLDLHPWKFPVERVVLAEVTNDRAGEWAYAYAVPGECISELRVLPTYDPAADGIPLFAGFALSPWMLGTLTTPPLWRFLIAGSKIYSNMGNATLEFLAGAPNEATFRPQFERAFVLELACRLVMPLIGTRGRQGELIKMAEAARARAITDELNRDDSESVYGDVYMNETQLARQGGGQMGGLPFSPFDPWGR